MDMYIKIMEETYQYSYVYDYTIQIKPKDDKTKKDDFILKWTIYDGEADDSFAEVIVEKYYTVNAGSNITDTIENVYFSGYYLQPCKLEIVEEKQTDFIKDFMLTKVTFESESFVYDGTSKALQIKGVYPDTVNVSYDNNNQCEVGTYEVKATLSGENFKTIELKAKLTIVNPEDVYTISQGSQYNFIYGISGLKTTSIQNLFIPDKIGDTNIRCINNNAFLYNTAIKTVKMENITVIGVNAFRGCTSLEWVVIPSSIVEIYEGAFDYTSTNLKVFFDTDRFGSWGTLQVYFKGEWAYDSNGNPYVL